jgi:hypothetical protein
LHGFAKERIFCKIAKEKTSFNYPGAVFTLGESVMREKVG